MRDATASSSGAAPSSAHGKAPGPSTGASQDLLPEHVIWGGVDCRGRPRQEQVCSIEVKALSDSQSCSESQSQWRSCSESQPSSVAVPTQGGGLSATEGPQHCVWSSHSSDTSSSTGKQRLEELAKSVPRDDNGLPLSLGSSKHGKGDCRPCLFAYSKGGCQNGVSCEFCHFYHKKKNRGRPCKGQRDRFRKLLDRVEQMVILNPDVLDESSEQLLSVISNDKALRSKLISKVQARVERSRSAVESAGGLPLAEEEEDRQAEARRPAERRGEAGEEGTRRCHLLAL